MKNLKFWYRTNENNLINNSSFLVEIQRTSNIIRDLLKDRTIRIISHYDCDGICSAAILTKALSRENANFQVNITKQPNERILDELKIYKNSLVIFSDLGSGQLKLIEKKLLEENIVVVLDHHRPQRVDHPNLHHINPLLFNESEVSGSVVSFLFAKNLNEMNVDLIDLALVGAVGDALDEKWRLKGLNKIILKEAEKMGKVSIIKGLRLYGMYTRPVHKALELSIEPFIPGISGSESNAVQFLSELGIKIKDDGRWRMLGELSIEEQKKLASAIIVERLKKGHMYPEDVFGEVYMISNREAELSNAREFATLLNACGRLGRYDLGLRLCYNELHALNDARELMNEYRRHLSEYLNWIEENVKNENVVKSTENAHFIFAYDKIMETMIGTVTSILMNSDVLSNKKFIFGFTNSDDGVKISARASRDVNLNLGDVLIEAVKHIGGEAGGHVHAAGATIPFGTEKKFIENIEKLLDRKSKGVRQKQQMNKIKNK